MSNSIETAIAIAFFGTITIDIAIHRYHVVACFTKTLQKQDIYRHIHGNCANNPVWWTNYNIELFMIYNRFQVCMKRNSNFRATFAH